PRALARGLRERLEALADQPALELFRIGRLFRQRARLHRLVEQLEQSWDALGPLAAKRSRQLGALTASLLRDQLERIGESVRGEEPGDVRHDLAGAQRMGAGQRGAQHVQEL